MRSVEQADVVCASVEDPFPVAGRSTPTVHDLVAFMDLRTKVNTYFDSAVDVWLQHKIATDPDFTNVVWELAYFEGIEDGEVVIDYFPDGQAHSDNESKEVRVPLAEFVPEYGHMRAVLDALA